MTTLMVDLTQRIHNGMQLFQLHSPTHVIPWGNRDHYGWATNALFINEHGGTHLDAPFHFDGKGQTIDQIPLEKLSGPALALDFTEKWPKGIITAADLERSTSHNPLQEGDGLVLWTGADQRIGSSEYLESYPGISADAAEYLISKGTRLVATDAASIDHPDDSEFPVHHCLLPNNVLIVENLAHLEKLITITAGKRFMLHTFPLKIENGTGSPVRAVAIIEKE